LLNKNKTQVNPIEPCKLATIDGTKKSNNM
jgi:hypothetical protein